MCWLTVSSGKRPSCTRSTSPTASSSDRLRAGGHGLGAMAWLERDPIPNPLAGHAMNSGKKTRRYTSSMSRRLVAFVLALVLSCHGFAAVAKALVLTGGDAHAVAHLFEQAHHHHDDGSVHV